MPQIFQVLRCYKCSVFQIHQTKKSNKFECKICGEKQSIKRHYGIGTAKDCRLHVQKLNSMRADLDDLKGEILYNTDDEEPDNEKSDEKKTSIALKKSKWSEYVSQQDSKDEEVPEETMYLDDKEVVLELPRKKRKTFQKPVKREMKTNAYNPTQETNVPILNNNIDQPVDNISVAKHATKCNPTTGVGDSTKASYCNAFLKTNSNLLNINTNVDCAPIDNYSYPTKYNPIRGVQDSIESTYCHVTSETNSIKFNTNKDLKAHVEVNLNSKAQPAKFKCEPRNISNSKWVKYIETNISDENISNPDDTADSQNNVNLFSLCDDAELDDVLDF